MEWKQGPLPPGTFGWGGVTTADSGNGFFFADFHGDHVETTIGQRLEPADVLMYNNGLTLPSGKTTRTK